MRLDTGRLISHYRLVERLGEGGMGVVWKALDTTLAREVALKLLPPSLSADPEHLEMFEREARALASLNHPNIVTVFSVEEAEGHRFLTMELVRGRTLGAIIPVGGMPLRALLEIAVPLTDAIDAAHRRGIAHRDTFPGGTYRIINIAFSFQASSYNASYPSVYLAENNLNLCEVANLPGNYTDAMALNISSNVLAQIEDITQPASPEYETFSYVIKSIYYEDIMPAPGDSITLMLDRPINTVEPVNLTTYPGSQYYNPESIIFRSISYQNDAIYLDIDYTSFGESTAGSGNSTAIKTENKYCNSISQIQ